MTDNPPAFPNTGNRFDGRIAEGMTLRDWFAGQALAGLYASETDDTEYEAAYAARRSYVIADAMLAERAK